MCADMVEKPVMFRRQPAINSGFKKAICSLLLPRREFENQK
jgi:hypothetical protein